MRIQDKMNTYATTLRKSCQKHEMFPENLMFQVPLKEVNDWARDQTFTDSEGQDCLLKDKQKVSPRVKGVAYVWDLTLFLN